MKKINCSICNIKYTKEIKNDINFATIQKDTTKNPYYICSDCIEKMANAVGLFNGLFDGEFSDFMEIQPDLFEKEKKDLKNDDIPLYKKTTPKKIKKYLDEYIIGQEQAKKIISVAYYNHLKRISVKTPNIIKKANILLVGPTGSGKTLLAQKLAEMSGVPFAIADATTFTKKGYVGEDVDNIIIKLLNNADGNISLAEQGIVYIDECDKLATYASGDTSLNVVGGEGVQQALLKLIEGTKISVSLSPTQQVEIDTKNILFICGGAFTNLYTEIIESKKNIGFNNISISNFSSINVSDFIKYGMIAEFMGRLPIIATLNKLTEEDFIKILQEPKDSICNEYKQLFLIDNIILEFEKDALIEIAHNALSKDLGARGLRTILENYLNEIMFSLITDKKIKKIIITKSFLISNDLNDLILVY